MHVHQGYRLDVGIASIEKGRSTITLMQQRIEHIADSALRMESETGLVKGLELYCIIRLLILDRTSLFDDVSGLLPNADYQLTGWTYSP